MSLKLALLDRDGTINVDKSYLYRTEQWEFAPGAIAAIKALRTVGFGIAVATNQSGIGRGQFTEQDFWKLQEFVQRQLARFDVTIDAVALCPHHPDAGCACRKPRTGMAKQIEQVSAGPIDYAASWVVGDKLTDVAFGRNLGANTGLIRSDYWDERSDDTGIASAADIVGDSLLSIVEQILRRSIVSNKTNSDG